MDESLVTNALALVTSAKPQEEDGLLRNLDELDDSAIREMVASEFKCMICLQVMKKTMTVKECLHRFCNDCIQVKFAFPRLSLSLSLLICLFFTDWIFYPYSVLFLSIFYCRGPSVTTSTALCAKCTFRLVGIFARIELSTP